MTSASWLNGVAVVVALGVATAIGSSGRGGALPEGETSLRAAQLDAQVVDASGHATRVRPFRRVAAGSSVADRLLVELCDADRIIGFTAYGSQHSPMAHQYAGKAQVGGGSDLERILSLKPDLFVTNSFGSPASISRLREAGVEVFDLGEMRGEQTLLDGARALARLLGHPERGERFAHAFAVRFAHVAASVDASHRRRGMYLSLYGDQIFGGAKGSTYHEVVTHGGLIDVTDGKYTGWPQFSTEQVLMLDPDVIVSKAGMRHVICDRPELAGLTACKTGLVVEVDFELLDDPGPAMLDAAERVFDAVYGKR